MKNIRNIFNSKQLEILDNIGISFNNNVDYDDNTLIEYHDIIIDKYLSQFDKKGNPNDNAILLEQIIDIFFDKLNI